jgi:hypothetical protein
MLAYRRISQIVLVNSSFIIVVLVYVSHRALFPTAN